jgi:hypothetical protein
MPNNEPSADDIAEAKKLRGVLWPLAAYMDVARVIARVRGAAYRQGIEDAAQAACGPDHEGPTYSEDAAAYQQGRLDAREDIRALTPPQEGS